MSITPSASSEIRTLLAALASDDAVAREAAVARLAIIGPRAVERILAAYAAAGSDARAAMLRALEGIGDSRALAVAREALSEGGAVAAAATGTLRALLTSPAAGTAADALDALIAVALDSSRERTLRLAALDALAEMPGDVRARVEEALRADTDAAVRARAADMPTESAAAEAAWLDARDGRLADSPGAVREAVSTHGADAPLSTLQTLIDHIHQRERDTTGAERAAWLTTRGAIHQILALRASRVALYDLRETIEAAVTPLPPSFLAALHAVGDESCLPAIAAAHKRSDDERWRGQLEAAFHAIVKREKLGRKKSARLLG